MTNENKSILLQRFSKFTFDLNRNEKLHTFFSVLQGAILPFNECQNKYITSLTPPSGKHIRKKKKHTR